MFKVKLVESDDYAKREVTVKQTTKALWRLVDILEDKAKEYDLQSFKIVGDDFRMTTEDKARGLRWMAGEIKRQLVDDINKEIDRQLDNGTNVSRETIDIRKKGEK